MTRRVTPLLDCRAHTATPRRAMPAEPCRTRPCPSVPACLAVSVPNRARAGPAMPALPHHGMSCRARARRAITATPGLCLAPPILACHTSTDRDITGVASPSLPCPARQAVPCQNCQAYCSLPRVALPRLPCRAEPDTPRRAMPAPTCLSMPVPSTTAVPGCSMPVPSTTALPSPCTYRPFHFTTALLRRTHPLQTLPASLIYAATRAGPGTPSPTHASFFCYYSAA